MVEKLRFVPMGEPGRRPFLVAWLMLVSLAPWQAHAWAQAPVPQPLRTALERIDALAEAEYAKDNVGSLTIGVVAGGELIWTKSYGWADAEQKIPATKDTVYRIASITKWLTGLMLLQLLGEGKVKLSDPVEKYFPEIKNVQGRPAKAPPITLEQLATMRSGLDREPANVRTYNQGPLADWEKVLLAALPQTKYVAEPGTRYLYSNIGYVTLGAALSRAADMPYVEYMQKRILSPLKMTQTGFELKAMDRAKLAKGYEISADGKVSFDVPLRYHEGRGCKVPSGALYATVGDLARFLAFELGEGPDKVLKKDLLEENFRRAAAASGGQNFGYGIGLMMLRQGDLVTFGHIGAFEGYIAQAQIHRPSKTGVIVLRNASGGKFNLAGLTFRALAALAELPKD
jgi:CubicO group peptidase (beta-lactamase class C family)